MADIGVPQFTESRDNSGSSAGADVAAAGEAIGGAAKAIAEGMSNKKTEQLRSDLAELGETALNSTEAETVATPYSTPPGLNAEEEMVYKNLRRLQGLANQTTGSKRAQVLNKAKQIAQNAMSTSRSPTTRSRLITEFNQFVGLSPALDQLGLQDQQDSVDAEFAEKQMQVIFDQTYDKVSDGGFGIPASVPFGGDQWVREFTYRQKKFAQDQANEFAIQSFDTSNAVSVRQAVPVLDQALQDSRNVVDGVVGQHLSTAIDVGKARQRLAANQAVEGDVEAIAGWDSGGKQVAQSHLLQQIGELDQYLVALQGQGNIDEFGKGTIKRIEAAKSYVERQIQSMEILSEVPDVVKLMEYEQKVREINWRNKNPLSEELNFNLTQMAPVIEVMDTLDLQDTLMADNIGQFALKNVQDTFATNDVFGDAWQRLTGDASKVLDRANYERSTANDVFGADSETTQARAVAALNQIGSSIAQRPNFEVVLRDKNVPIPPNFFNAYMSEASHLEELRQGENFQPATLEQVEKFYGSGVVLDQTMAARSRRLRPGENTAIQALGEALFRYNTDSDIVGRKARVGNIQQVTLNQIPLSDVITYNFDKLVDGEVSITVAPDAGKRASETSSELKGFGDNSYMILTPPSAHQQSFEQAAQQLENHINRFLKYEANVAMLRGNAQTPNYVLTWDQNRYNDIFFARPRGE